MLTAASDSSMQRSQLLAWLLRIDRIIDIRELMKAKKYRLEGAVELPLVIERPTTPCQDQPSHARGQA